MVLVLDRSGSMDGPKMEQAKDAARAFVAHLEDADQLGLVHFGSDVVRFERRNMDPAGKAAALALISTIHADGATNIGAALEAGCNMLLDAPGTRRLVLASDGQPTVGQTSPEELARLVEQVHARRITVTALGIGADYNGPLMARFAELGGGFYGYLSSASQLSEILGQELAQARTVNVQNVRLHLEPAPGVSLLEVPGRQLLNGTDVLLPDFKPGDEARVFARLSTRASSPGTRGLLTARVTWTRASSQDPAVTLATLNIGVSDDAVAVERSRDEAVFANAVTAQATTQLVEAAAALERGNREEALTLFARARAIFGTSASALAGQSAMLANTEHELRTIDPRHMQSKGKDMEQKGLKNFGENNSYGY
jgi:Ca-activated chloride channel family protein